MTDLPRCVRVEDVGFYRKGRVRCIKLSLTLSYIHLCCFLCVLDNSEVERYGESTLLRMRQGTLEGVLSL